MLSLHCVLQIGGEPDGPHTGDQGDLLFGNLLCRTALRCLKVLVVILSFPNSAHQEKTSVGTCVWCMPPDWGRCAWRGWVSECPGRRRTMREAALIRIQAWQWKQFASLSQWGDSTLNPDKCWCPVFIWSQLCCWNKKFFQPISFKSGVPF
jgi:hypothetical protein